MTVEDLCFQSLVRKCFRSGVNIARARSFPGADIGSDHDLLMITFHLRLKRISKPKHTRLKFYLEKLKDPNVLETFQTMIGWKFAPLIFMVIGANFSSIRLEGFQHIGIFQLFEVKLESCVFWLADSFQMKVESHHQ